MFTTSMPDTRSKSNREIAVIGNTATVQKWVKGRGEKVTRYAIDELTAHQNHRRFKLTKADGTTYLTCVRADVYSLFACTCPAGTKGRAGLRCDHVDVCWEIVHNAADELETVRDLDAEAEDRDSFYSNQ